MNHPLSYSFTHQLICSFTHTILSIYAIGKNSPRIFAFSACSAVRKNVNQQNKKMQNEPNLKNTQMILTSVKKRYYGNFHPLAHPKNEPNLRKKNPIAHLLIYPFIHLLIDSIMQNEPNTNPIYPEAKLPIFTMNNEL